jgi:hypothetical protein
MDEMHHRHGLRSAHTAHPATGRGVADERDGLNWRDHLGRLHKSKAVRTHVRCWLLGLISFGPIR